ncbi:Oxoglutarate/iron-dependent dioxygenase - like 10 [Theobroma cacao]|nr:Oxoglutarate/iron-dependent dioxygenase - like 10 [Theobroma cacao]
MEILGNGKNESDCDRMKELKAFDDTKLGVQGLVDSGVMNIPKMFLRSANELAEELNHSRSHIRLPVIDLNGLLTDQRRKIVDQIQNGVRQFHEQDLDERKEFYSRGRARRVRFNSNHDLFQSNRADRRDTLSVSMLTSDHVDPNELPTSCRDAAIEFINQTAKVGDTLFELLSEACPEPELAMGVTKHTDNTFLTILAENQTSGLQVLHESQWVDVHPIAGSLVVNIGDLVQVVSNDKFKSNMHRVLPRRVPRISVICFFTGRADPPARLDGPIKELISEGNPSKYRELLVSEYVSRFFTRGLHEKPSLKDYRL